MGGWVPLDRDVERGLRRKPRLARIYRYLLVEAAVEGPDAGGWHGSHRTLARAVGMRGARSDGDARAALGKLIDMGLVRRQPTRTPCPHHGQQEPSGGALERHEHPAASPRTLSPQLTPQPCPPTCPHPPFAYVPLMTSGCAAVNPKHPAALPAPSPRSLPRSPTPQPLPALLGELGELGEREKEGKRPETGSGSPRRRRTSQPENPKPRSRKRTFTDRVCAEYPNHYGRPFTGFKLRGAVEGKAADRLLAAFPDDAELWRVIYRAWPPATGQEPERAWWSEKATTLAGLASIAAEVAAAPAANARNGSMRARTDLSELERWHYNRARDIGGMSHNEAIEYAEQQIARRQAG